MMMTIDEEGRENPLGAWTFVVGIVPIAGEGERFPEPSAVRQPGKYTCHYGHGPFDWKRGDRIDHDCPESSE